MRDEYFEDVIPQAAETVFVNGAYEDHWVQQRWLIYQLGLERGKSQHDEQLGQVAAWAISLGFSTGHADTMGELLAEIGAQVLDGRKQRAELLAAVTKYAMRYLQDERDEPEICMNAQHHEDVVALFEAIAKAGGSNDAEIMMDAITKVAAEIGRGMK